MIINGEFFSEKKKNYNDKTLNCVKESYEKLSEIGDKPLMMLGKIQSGKTRSFIGLISLAFDNDFDLAVVLTKNSNALARQTTSRMKDEFSCFLEEDMIEIFDIMCIPKKLTKFELEKKMILVVKKEQKNLPRLLDFIEKYSLYENKKCLIIDDEADYCSVGYGKNKDTDGFDLRKISSLINDLRLQLTCKFVQVTATPYSLYLQPEHIDLDNNIEIKPVKPSETVLVPYGDGYIGGDYYFNSDKDHLGKYLFNAIEEEEFHILKKSDKRKFKIEDILESEKIAGLRRSIINFVVAGCVRIIQNGGVPRGKKNKFSFIIHTEISKSAHIRQDEIVDSLFENLEIGIKENYKLVDEYILESYNNILDSVDEYGYVMPKFEETIEFVKKAISEQWIARSVVNSESDIDALLSEDGQLKLRSPLNIFIGGQILDRGITISNLIGFYYGRSPKKMQQDTVLQHSRMFGYRSKEDMSVTRFYTTRDLYTRMSKINEFDTKLREDFEQGNFYKGVIFISKDSEGKVIPCSPQKLIISNTHVLKAGKTTTPVGFNTKSKTHIKNHISKIDKILMSYNNKKISGEFTISKDDACNIIDLIYKTIDIESNNCIDSKAFISLINYLSKDNVKIFSRENRNISRLRKTSRYYSDMPYNRDRDLKKAKEMAIEEPTLMLMKQNGTEGWKGGPFYWPVLVTPEIINTAVYTSELLK